MSRRLSKNKIVLSLILSMAMFFQFNTINVSAIERNTNNSMQAILNEELLFNIENVTSYTDPHYFIKEQIFSFTDYNIGQPFYVPTACQGRMQIAIVAEDGSRTDHVKIQVCSQANSSIIYHSEEVPTQQAKLIIVDRMGASTNLIRYYGGRPNVKYTVNIKFYTWDY